MYRFIVNKNAQTSHRGEHEVHNLDRGCSHLPLPQNQVDLGYHANCRNALAFVREKNPNHIFDGCKHCATECHTG